MYVLAYFLMQGSSFWSTLFCEWFSIQRVFLCAVAELSAGAKIAIVELSNKKTINKIPYHLHLHSN